MIEEMRHRLEQMQGLLVTRGGDVAAELEKALKETGLKDLMEAKTGKSLKNVYERLYQDALQRMQRVALILEQKAEAKELYFASVVAAKKLKGSQAHAPPPDLDRLTDAALTAIHGMWYHYDILFRNICEQSTAQSVRDNAIDGYRLALSDVFGNDLDLQDFEDLGSLRVPQDVGNGRNAQVRPFVERRISNSAGAVSPGGGIAFAAPSAKGRVKRVLDKCDSQSDFKSYMSKLQESGQAPSTPTTQLHAQRRQKADKSDSLTALTTGGKRNGLSASLSLPALPKGLANLKSQTSSWVLPGERDPSSQKTSTMETGLPSGESSLVLQDSWMTGAWNDGASWSS